jgi:hypothetical protein
MGSQLAALSLSLILPSSQDDWHKKAAFITVLSFKNVWMRYDYLYLRVCPSDRPFNFCAIMATVLLYPISFALLFKNIWMKSD